jgi:hypothetical protein
LTVVPGAIPPATAWLGRAEPTADRVRKGTLAGFEVRQTVFPSWESARPAAAVQEVEGQPAHEEVAGNDGDPGALPHAVVATHAATS